MGTGSDGLEAVILAGGLGTRLQSVVKGRPKPMAEVGGRPFVEWLLLRLVGQGVRRVVLATGYLASTFEDHFRLRPVRGLEIEFSREDRPLGTGGALRLALRKIGGERLLVLNGDSYCQFELPGLTQGHDRAGAQATLYLVPVDDCGRYGSVRVLPDGRVTEFVEKSIEGRSGLINTGVYVFNRSVVEAIAPDANVSLEKDVLPGLVGRGLYATVGSGPFIDIGTPESFVLAQEFVPASFSK